MLTERAGTREWLGLAALALPTILLALDLTVLYMALPHLGADLGASNTELLWITDSYGFMVAGALVTMGTVGDRIGRRKLLLIGAAAFTAASVLAAYSTTTEMLITARVLLGLAGATLGPSTLSLISTMFRDDRQRSMAIGLWLTSFSIGGAVGPAVGGMLLEHFWWGSVFLLGVPVMVVLLIVGPLLLPEHRGTEPARLDLISVGLSLAAILPVVYGAKEIARAGVHAIPLASVGVGVAVGVLFVRRQRSVANPLLDLRLFAQRKFTGALSGMLLGAITLYSFTFYFTQHLQLVEELSPVQAGLWFIPLVAATITAATISPLAARRFQPASVIAAGCVVAAAGFGVLTTLSASSGLAVLMTGGIVIGIGINPLLVLSTDLVVGSVPPDQAGSAAALSETGGELGASLGIASLGTLGTAIYSSDLTIPTGTPAEVATTARESFADAFAVAEKDSELLTAAKDAFLSGMTTVTAVSAVILLGIAGLVLAVLRHVPRLG